MPPRSARVVRAEHAVVVDRDYAAVARGANGVEVDFVALVRLVRLVEFCSMRQRHDASAKTILRLHAIAQVVRL